MSNHNNKYNEVESLFKNSMQTEVPQEVKFRLHRQLIAFRKRLEQRQSSRRENLVMSIFRKNSLTKIGWAASTAIIVIFIALAVGLNPWSRKDGTAYAKVLEQIRNAHTAEWTWTLKLDGNPDQKMKVLFMEPSCLRVSRIGDGEEVSICDLAKGKCLTLTQKDRKFFEIDLVNMPLDIAGVNFIEKLRTIPERKAEFLGEREMDGKTVKGFRISKAGRETIVWADTTNSNLVRVEINISQAPETHLEMTDIQMNVPVDQSLFSLTPPEGYSRRRKYRIDLSRISEMESQPAELPPGQVKISPALMPENSIWSNEGEYSAKGISLLEIICEAYAVQSTRTVLDFSTTDDVYNVYLKMPKGQENLLWQTLRQDLKKKLEVNFGITVREETREEEAFLLTVAGDRKSNLREPASNKSSSISGDEKKVFRNVSLNMLASELESLLHQPVLNETNLNGQYDFEFRCPQKSPEAILTAVREQLGLELVSSKRPIKMLIVEKKKENQQGWIHQ